MSVIVLSADIADEKKQHNKKVEHKMQVGQTPTTGGNKSTKMACTL